MTVKGSDTMVLLGQRWAERFMKTHPEAKLQVTGGGSGTGLAALINGTTDIAMSSRPIKDAERQMVRQRHPTGPVEVAVALDGITFYVHESNPVEALTLEQLKAIYLGDLTRWKDVGGNDAPIVVYSRENSSGTYVFVKDEVLDGEDFTSRALTLPGTAAVVNAVAQERNGIGYGGSAYARGIKELKVKKDAGSEAVAPTAQNIQQRRLSPVTPPLLLSAQGGLRHHPRLPRLRPVPRGTGDRHHRGLLPSEVDRPPYPWYGRPGIA